MLSKVLLLLGLDLMEEGVPKRSSLLLGNVEDELVNGGAGMPVNS